MRAGGWGPQLADQGSGHFIGLEALRRGFLAIDEQRETRVLDEAQRFWKLASRSELIEYANANPSPEYSRLTPMVVSLAGEGDGVAREVLVQGGEDLAMLASLVIERIRRIEGEANFALPAVAVAGSILEKVGAVREAMTAALRKRYAGIEVMERPADPPAGALWAARNA